MTISRSALRAVSWLAAGIAGIAGISAPATAAPNVSTDSAVFVERRTSDSAYQLEPAIELARGDQVVTILRWYRLGGNGGFTITNPLPRTIAYQKSSRRNELVSVDGGRTWGLLGTLRTGSRLATPEDVTHVRWRISADRAERGSGRIAYRGIVR